MRISQKMDNNQRKNMLQELTGARRPQKNSPLMALLVLILVVAGASAGGYFIHKKFRAVPSQETATTEELVIDEGLTFAESSPAASPASRPAPAPATPATPTAPAATPAASSSSAPPSTVPLSSELMESAGIATSALPADPGASSAASGAAAPALAAASAASATSPATPATPATATTSATPSPAASTGRPVATPPAPADNSPAMSAQERLLAADRFVAEKNYARARTTLQAIPASDKENYPAALYRLGLVGRYSQDEQAAQTNWKTAYEKFPETVSGRLSALALGDTWYHWYAQSSKDFSKWEEIRNAYSTAIGMDGARFLDAATEARLATRLNELNQKLVFDPAMKVTGASFHTVRPGEYISTIAPKYGLDSWTSIVAINGIDPNRLREGATLKIMSGRLFILVDKSRFTLSWYLDGRFIKRYRCAIGAPETETPPGHYAIFKMDVNPTWTDPKTGRMYKYGEQGHLIGSRWLAMRGEGTSGLGIHGTVDPASIGKKASNGCIRLLKDDVEELYGFASIQPGNETEVLVIE